MSKIFIKLLRSVSFLTVWVLFLAPLVVWSALAVWFDSPLPRPFTAVVSLSLVLIALVTPLMLSRVAAVAIVVICSLSVACWWLTISPRNDRDWSPEVARNADVKFDGHIATIKNVRNFSYRSETDYSESWETREYDLEKINGLDLFLSYWGTPWMAHTILSWSFSDGQHLAISIETRKEKGEEYSAIRGLFRQFELYHVVATETDLIGLRTNHRKEDVYLYRIDISQESARNLLKSYLQEIDLLIASPKWYNAITTNCTTAIRGRRQEAGQAGPWHWRILVNGYLDQLLYFQKVIAHDRPFAELKKASAISARAQAVEKNDSFSEAIRQGLPMP